jgi:hypothetical protein
MFMPEEISPEAYMYYSSTMVDGGKGGSNFDMEMIEDIIEWIDEAMNQQSSANKMLAAAFVAVAATAAVSV